MLRGILFKAIQFLLLLKLCCATVQPKLGDECDIPEIDAHGVCTLIGYCPVSVLSLSFTDICSPHNTGRVVCCVGAKRITYQSKSLAKCKEYSRSLNCELKSLNEISLNGNHLKTIKDFPHLASIQYKTAEDSTLRQVFHDQAVLISSRYVLSTAASVSKDDGWIPARVLLGLLDQQIWVDRETVEFGIDKIIVHPNYDSPLVYNDIALIKLSRKVKFSQFVRPICLPDTNADSLPSVVHRIDYQVDDDKRSVVKYERRFVPIDICNKTYDVYYAPEGINNDFICTTSRELGDSNYAPRVDGAPISIDHPNVPCSRILSGLSIIYMKTRIADAAINIYNYREWIESIIWADGEDI